MICPFHTICKSADQLLLRKASVWKARKWEASPTSLDLLLPLWRRPGRCREGEGGGFKTKKEKEKEEEKEEEMEKEKEEDFRRVELIRKPWCLGHGRGDKGRPLSWLLRFSLVWSDGCL